MARIRKICIENFRCIKRLIWLPSPGINCLIGPGDNGKSTILDAIDFCLGARRNLQVTDADFHRLNVDESVRIAVTIGELDDALKNFDSYGQYLQGFDLLTDVIEDEPSTESEAVLTLQLTVASDLDAVWTLISERAQAQGLSRNLNWQDRVRVAPNRIGAFAGYHFSWGRGSVLNRLSDEKADASAALAKAARNARAAFGDEAEGQLAETLDIVAGTARALGIPVGDDVRALLDVHSVSFSGGTISLHDEDGVPLRGLGTGSTRLLIAGLQRKAAAETAVMLVDETEHGLEPHRIIRFVTSLGAKEEEPPLQVFMTTHSPVVLRELSGNQLFVARRQDDGNHAVSKVGIDDEIQSTVRLYPEAFLARSVLICEGASEVGFVRGVDLYRVGEGETSIAVNSVALVDCGGGDAERCFRRAAAFQNLGYRTAILRDSDIPVAVEVQDTFTDSGGTLITWRDECAIEDELFRSLTDGAVDELIDLAIELHGEDLIDQHIKTVSDGAANLDQIHANAREDGYSDEARAVLGKAARIRKSGWFKSVTWMETTAREIVGPDLAEADATFRATVEQIFDWARDGGG